MRVGTQTLIQALTAIPWTDDVENDDDILNHDPDLVSGVESDDEDKFGKLLFLFSTFLARLISHR